MRPRPRLVASLLALLRLVAAWQRTPSPSGTPYAPTTPPLEVLVPGGSVFNAFVGLYNPWPAPVEGPPRGGVVAVPLRRRRLRDVAAEPGVSEPGADEPDAAEPGAEQLAAALAAMGALAAAQSALRGPAGEQHGLTAASPPYASLGAEAASVAYYTHGAGRRLAREPRPAQHRQHARRAAMETLPAALRATMHAPHGTPP